MSDLKEIKERIYEEELIEMLLEELECESISTEQHGNLFTAQLPSRFDSQNTRAVQIKNTETLPSYIRNKGISGDIFAIIGFILFDCETFEEVKENLFQIKIWICNLFEWEEYISGTHEQPKEVKKKDWNFWLRGIQTERKMRKTYRSLEKKMNRTISKKILNRYLDYPHIHFVKDGIRPQTQKEFGVMFCLETERIVYPVHDKSGNLIGVKGRYVGETKSVAENKKYLYLYRCDKSIELFNLHRAYSHIQERDEVIVFESAKSCMLAYQYGYYNVVSIEGNEISPYQAFLLKSLNCKIVFAFDKDINKNHIEKQVNQIKSRICFCLYDNDNLLEEKDAPVDKGMKIFDTLYNKYKFLVK